MKSIVGKLIDTPIGIGFCHRSLFSCTGTGVNRNILARTQSSSAKMEDDVLFKDVEDKGLITLNRPKALNSLNSSMVQKILAKLREWESKKKLVVVEGAGGKAFCAGGDVKSIALSLLEANGEKYGLDFFRMEYTMDHLIGTYPVPYIALINGITMGGGVGISVHGKYRVATENTLFAMPETAIGLFPDVGATYFLPRLNGQLGYFLGLTGHRLKGTDVLHAGIATHFVPSDKLADLKNQLLSTNESDIGSVIKSFQPKDLNNEFSLTPYMKQINNCFSANSVEGIIERLKADGTEWAQNVIEMLLKMSPTALKVTKKSLDIGKHKNLAECLQMEYEMGFGALKKNSDFFEGVRAVLIDKDQKPNWNPKTLSEVTDEMVSKRFSKLPKDLDLKL